MTFPRLSDGFDSRYPLRKARLFLCEAISFLLAGREEGIDMGIGLRGKMVEEDGCIVRGSRQPFIRSGQVCRVQRDVFRDRKRRSDSGEFEEPPDFYVLR